MKRIRLILLAVLAANVTVAMVASAKGLLPSMVYRRGLTNEQIDRILSVHPDAQLRMTAQDWRAMRYQLCRFDCMTNYVEMIGGSNDCARILLQLHDDATTAWSRYANTSNALAKTLIQLDAATERANEYAEAYASAEVSYADATNRLQTAMADYMSASNRAARAEAKVARTEAFKSWLIEQRDNARLSTTKVLYQAIIDKLEGDE